MIIDIHAHVCDTLAAITQGEPLRSLRYGLAQIGNRKVQFFPPSFENSNSPVEALIAQMNASGVDKALLMANPYYGYTNDYFIESVNIELEKAGTDNRILNVSPGSLKGTRFNGQENNISLL